VPLTLIGYFLIFTAGPAYSRFRVPIVPFIAVLAGVGWAPWLTRSAFQGRRRAVGDTASDDARAIAAERR